MLNLLKKRRSVRQFKKTPVPESVVAGLLKAATLAPSAYNRQPWKYIVLEKDFSLNEVIMEGNEWLLEAPLVLAVFSRKGESHFNAGLSVENLVIQATDQDLSAHIVGGFYKDRLSILVKSSDDYEAVCMIGIGYPLESNRSGNDKKNEPEIAYKGVFGKPWKVLARTKPLKYFEYSVNFRFRDLDAMGHVNNAVYLTYMEEARIATRDLMVGKVKEPLSFNVVVAEHDIQYKKPIVYGENIIIKSWISHIRNKSYRFNYNIINDKGELKAEAYTVMVGYNYKTGEVLDISDTFKEAVSDYTV